MRGRPVRTIGGVGLTDLIDAVDRLLRELSGAEVARWIAGRMPPTPGLEGYRLGAHYAAAGRVLDDAPAGEGMDAGLCAAMTDAGVEQPARWTLLDLYRYRLLADALNQVSPDEHLGVVRSLFCKGGIGEQRSLVRSLILLPEPAAFLPVAIEACRGNVLDVFIAMTCENRYPAYFFPDLNFNQMVMKALFNGVALARIAGLARRRTRELARMAADYATERRAAGRSIPNDIDMIIEN
ncbi:MAG: hypothetical protein NFCOHLIN_02660 [Gammaproteobacteria bacterium]|nr:hypothetical protein [Gammaproteobacteria bacterium]